MLEAWLILRRFWYVVPIIALSFAALALYADNRGKAEKLTVAVAKNDDLTKANKNAAATIASFAQQRIDNDAIANAIAARIKITNTRETVYTNTIQKVAANDPQVRDWRAVAVPASVRSALSPDRSNAAPR